MGKEDDEAIWEDAVCDLSSPDAASPTVAATSAGTPSDPTPTAAALNAAIAAAGTASVATAVCDTAVAAAPVPRRDQVVRQPRPPGSAMALFLEKPERCRRSRINFLVDDDDEIEEEANQTQAFITI